MQTCPTCGVKNPLEAQFCVNCTSALAKRCKNCSQIVSLDFKFCGYCGARVEPDLQPAPSKVSPGISDVQKENLLKSLQERMPAVLSHKIASYDFDLAGQRREVTILFLRIGRSTGLSLPFDDENVYFLIDQLMQVCVDIIYKYEGTVDKFTGDSLMALFGLPINHENDPERSVRAALEIQSQLTHFIRESRFQNAQDLQVRIGINTGPVSVEKVGSPFHIEYTVIGDTVNLASQLERATTPGKVSVSFRTYQRTRPIFDFLSLPALALKDSSEPDSQEPDSYEPIKSYQPLGVRSVPGQMRGLTGLRVPMVGRKDMLAFLINLLKKVQETQYSHIVLISGEAGLGKSRLVSEFRQYLTNQQCEVYQGNCASFMRAIPYRVVADMLRHIIQVSDLEDEEMQWDMLQSHLALRNLGQQEVLPYLLHVMGLAHLDPLLQTRLRLLNPDVLQRQTHTALRTFFLAEAQISPLVMIFEDLHWVDPATREFLDYFRSGIDSVPILLILVSRKFEDTLSSFSLLTNLKQKERMVEFQLQPLVPQDTRFLLDQLLPEATLRANQIKEEIAKLSAGNPYYIEEIVRTLIEQEGFFMQNGYWDAASNAREILQEVPGNLQDLILARFDRLSQKLRLILQKASVLGTSFINDLLQILVLETKDSLRAALEDLETRDFILRTQMDVYEGCIFKHPLVQNTIYHTILTRELQKFHFQVAQAVEEGHFGLSEERNEILAYHYAKSTQPEKAIPYLIAAAEHASRQYANEIAVQHYRQALTLMQKNANEGISTSQYTGVRIGLGQVLKFIGNFEESKEILEEAIRLILVGEPYLLKSEPDLLFNLINGLRELADIRAREGALDVAEGLLLAGINILSPFGNTKHPSQWRRLSDRLAWVYFRQGKLEEASKIASFALTNEKIWEEEDPIILASLSNTLGGISWQRGQLDDATRYVKQSLALYQKMNYSWGMAIAYTNLGILNQGQGKWAEAVSNFEHADQLRSEHGFTPERPTNLKNLGELLIQMGEHARAREKLQISRDISTQLGMNLAAAYAEIGLCRVSIILSELEEAKNHLDAARLRLGFDTNNVEVDDRLIQTLFLEAWIVTGQGELDKGLALSTQAYNYANQGGFSEEKIESLLVLGRLNLLTGAYAQAETHLTSAILLSEETGDLYRLGKAFAEMGMLYRTKGDSQMNLREKSFYLAHEYLQKALELFERLGANHDLKMTQSEKANLTVQVF